MVSRKKPNWVELLDGPCAGTRAIGHPDAEGCFIVERFLTDGVEAVPELHVYRQESAVLRQPLPARWLQQTDARPRVW